MNKTIQKFYKRRNSRMDSRHAEFNLDAGIGFAYGIAKSMGIDTTGMSPKEVFEAIGKESGGKSVSKVSSKVPKGSKKLGGKGKVTKGSTAEAKKNVEKMNALEPTVGMNVQGMSHSEVRKTLNGARKITQNHYDKARKLLASSNGKGLRTFTSHGPDHIDQVIERSNQAADEIEKLCEREQPNGFKFGKIDRKELLISAQFHDTGMDGGDGYNYGQYLKSKTDKNGTAVFEKYEDGKDAGGNGVRKDHGLNSAIHALENAEGLRAMGVSPSRIALLAFAHTKSMSGIKDLSNPDDWAIGAKKIHDIVDKYNEVHPDKKIEFNDDEVFEGGKPTVKNIGSLASAVAAVRLGDANREAKAPLKTQQGFEYNIDKHPGGNSTCVDDEINDSVISIVDDKGNRHELNTGDESDELLGGVAKQDLSKKVVLGERNMVGVSSKYNEKHGTLQEDITLGSGAESPYCTAEAIKERLGELNTINGIPRAIKVKMTGVSSSDIPKNVRKAYDSLWRNITTKTNEKGDCNEDYMPGINDIVLEFDDGVKYSSKKGVFGKQNMANAKKK